MQLTKNHYAAIAIVIIAITTVLLSQFPLENPKQNDLDDEKFYLNIPDYNGEEYYTNIPDYDIKQEPDDFFNNKPTPVEIPLEFSIETSGCLGEVKDNAFMPDEEKIKEVKENPVLTAGKNSIKVEHYGKLFCNGASKIDTNAFINTDGFVIILEQEEVDSDKFVYGPTTSPPEERLICICDYKTTVKVTGMTPDTYSVIVENKEGQDWLYEAVTVN